MDISSVQAASFSPAAPVSPTPLSGNAVSAAQAGVAASTTPSLPPPSAIVTLGAGTPASLLFNVAGFLPALAQVQANAEAGAVPTTSNSPNNTGQQLQSVQLPNDLGAILVLNNNAAALPNPAAQTANSVAGSGTAAAAPAPVAATTPGEIAFSRFQSLINDTTTLEINSVAGDPTYAAAAAALYLSTAVFRFQHSDTFTTAGAVGRTVNPIEKPAPSHSV